MVYVIKDTVGESSVEYPLGTNHQQITGERVSLFQPDRQLFSVFSWQTIFFQMILVCKQFFSN